MSEYAKKAEAYILGSQLEFSDIEYVIENRIPAIFITSLIYAPELMNRIDMKYEGELNLHSIGFCKMETHPECMVGSFFIPKLKDIPGPKYKLMMLINQRNIVIIDEEGFSQKLIRRIQYRRTRQGDTKEKFIYNFITEFLSHDMIMLAKHEKKLMELEDKVLHDSISDLQAQIVPLRNDLLNLQEYYDEIRDLGKELEENENGFFKKKELRYFGTISDRADRLMNKARQLLEYTKQIKDDYQTLTDEKQNKTMGLLTIISTIFLPLTLITSWYGMNFKNMPELDAGYPGVIMLSLLIIAFCIIYFKRKKML